MAHLDGDGEWIGEWHLPGAAKRVPGLLRYAGGQVGLELLHPLADVGEDETVATVLGHTRQGPVTLSDVLFDTPIQASAYSAVFAQPGDAGKVFEATFSFDLLKEWAIPGRLRENAAKVHDISNLAKFRASAVDKFEAQLDDDVKCTLTVSLAFSHHAVAGTRQYHDSWFRIKSKKGLSIWEIVNRYLYPIKHFLMAAMGRPLNLSTFHVILHKQAVEVYLPVNRQLSSGSRLSHFFNILGIKDCFEDSLRRWFDLHRKSSLHLRLFFKTLDIQYSDSLYFYVYAAVLEILNMANLTRAGGNYREQIKQELKLFENDFENMDEFADKIYTIRNAMVHHIPKYKLDDDELLRITHDLFYLIRVLLLEHCGIKVKHGAASFVFLKKRRDSERFSAAAGWGL